MKILNMMAILMACSITAGLSACSLQITNDGKTVLQVWDPKNPTKKITIASGKTKWTMAPEKDKDDSDGHQSPALVFAVKGTKNNPDMRYTLSMHSCTMDKTANTLDLSMIKNFVKTNSEKNGDRFTVVEEVVTQKAVSKRK